MIMHESYNESIDLWAVAVLTYELVMGEPPFQSSSNIETFNLILDVIFNEILYIYMYILPIG